MKHLALYEKMVKENNEGGNQFMNYLFIVNDGPYGNERAYNALRLAMTLQKTSVDVDITFSMIGDGVVNAINGQNTPNGFYNIGRMLKAILSKNGKVKL